MTDQHASSAPSKGSFTIRCPDCAATIVVDAATGTVLGHTERHKSSGADRDFDQLLANLDADKERAGALFEQERKAHNDRDRLLGERFEDALGRVEQADREIEEGKLPESPFKLD